MKKMKKIAVHSQKGGVGKTTIALLLAKYAATRGRRVCVLDFDFIGSGMVNLLKIDTPKEWLEDYFLHGSPQDYEIAKLLGVYTDDHVRPPGIGLVLNSGKVVPQNKKANEESRRESDMMGLVANEPHYKEIRTKTQVLFDLLEKHEFTLTIVDCHPGLGLVSATVRDYVDLNTYVTTLNRSDCFGLLREVNLQKLDNAHSLLVLNRTEPPAVDWRSFAQSLKNDPVLGPAGAAVLSLLKYMGIRDEHVALIEELGDMRTCFYLGTKGLLPRLEPEGREFNFCRKAMSLLGMRL